MAYRILLSILVAASITTCTASNVHHLQIPNQPPPGTQILSGSFQGYSMEMASFADIAGNLSSPNKLSYKMLQNLASISKSPPPIRVGGTTANHAIWTPDQKESIIQNFAVPGADQPANVTWGPSFLESFRVFPRGTGYTVGLTFGSGDEGERRSVEEARAFYDGVGGDLYAFEVGNEFDVFPVDRNETTWSISQYVREWLSRTTTITTSILPRNKSPKIFQAGAFVAPGTLNNDFSWTAPAAINLGITSTAHAKTFCTHQYFGAACRPVKPTLAGNLMNRTALAEYMQYHASASAYTVANGLPYVIGETNSIACQGLAGVSDVFGAAVWSVDYALYAASLNVSRIFWHMGTGYRYAAWQAVRNGTTEPGPRPLYYGNLFVANALGKGTSRVVSVLNTSSLAAYAVYSTGRRGGRSLKSVVLVNMEVFNSTASSTASRPSARFALPPQLFKKGKLSVQRLTAAGAEVREGISFAGQVVEKNGKITGECRKEGVRDGIVTISASEAVLISVD